MKSSQLLKGLFVFFTVASPATFVLPSVFGGAPTGSGPHDPLTVTGAWQTIAPNTSLWFYFDYAADRTKSKAAVALDANGAPNLQLAIYTPDQAKMWLRDATDPAAEPTAFGTALRDTAYGTVAHDLYWTGAFNTSGRYFAVVTNNNSTPIALLLTITGDTVQTAPPPTPTPTPTLFVPFTVTPVPTGTIQGKFVFQDAIGGMIYTVNGDGANLTAVSHGIDPAWSPDGKQIVFARWDNPSPGVYLANADGSDERIVFASPRVRSPRFSPDGTQIVFSQQKRETPQAVWKLGVVDLATGGLTEPQCSRLCFVPMWSPDGRTIVYTDPTVGIMATDKTSGAPWIVFGPHGYYFDTAKNAAMPILHLPPLTSSALSADGSRVAFMLWAQDHWDINLVNASGGDEIGVTRPDPILYVFYGVKVNNVAPVWSPDGKQILFLSDRNGKWEFFTISPAGSNLHQVLKSVTDAVSLRYDFQNERVIDWIK